jgi:hypothetical protein
MHTRTEELWELWSVQGLGCGLDCLILILGWDKRFSLLQDVQTFSGVHPSSYTLGVFIVPSPGPKWLQCEADGLAASIAKCENEWS